MTVPHCLSVTKYAYRQIIIPGHTARQQIKAAACISANDCRLSVKMRTKHTPLRQAVAQKGSVRSFRHIAIKSCVSAGSVFILSEIARNFMYQYVAAGACGDFFRVIDRFLLRSENFQRLFRNLGAALCLLYRYIDSYLRLLCPEYPAVLLLSSSSQTWRG